MKEFENINKDRKEVFKNEVFFDFSRGFYERRDGKKEKPKKTKDKSMSINIRAKKKDLEIFDFFSEIFKEKRASMIADIISHDVMIMFNSLGVSERTHLAEIVDEYMTEGGYDHEYKGRTWVWEVVKPDSDAYNPVNHKEWNIIKENLNK